MMFEMYTMGGNLAIFWLGGGKPYNWGRGLLRVGDNAGQYCLINLFKTHIEFHYLKPEKIT